MKLSILDQLPIREGGKFIDPINEAIEIAKLADDLGFHRYWTAQFHGTMCHASAAPEIITCRLASETKRIKIGAGGILLSNYSPYDVAEVFNMLETMFPGRIDLGIGRTTGGDGPTHAALLYGSPFGQEYFSQKVADLKSFLTGTPPSNPEWANVKATPVVETPPEVWLLGSGQTSAVHAADHGLALSFAHFINPYIYQQVIDDYRKHFKPSALMAKPQANLAVFVLCADTAAEAKELSLSRDLWWVKVFQGMDPPYSSLATAKSYPFTAQDRERLQQKHAAMILGTGPQVRDRLLALAEETGVDEIVVQTMCYDFAARKKSFQLLAEAFEMSA